MDIVSSLINSLASIVNRPGPNIPLNLPIIQIIILHLSTPLFKRKKLTKCIIIMTRMYNVMYISAGWHENFLFIISSEAKGTFSTPKNDQWLVIWAVYSSASSVWSQTHVTWLKVFYLKCTLCTMHTIFPWAVEKPIIQLLQEAAYYSKNYSRIFGPGLIVNAWRWRSWPPNTKQ